MRAHLPDEEVRGILVERLDGGQALGHRRNLVGTVRFKSRRRGRAGAVGGLGGCDGEAAPCAEPGNFAVERRVEACFVFSANERKHSAFGNGNIGVVGELQHAQRVQGLFVAPGIAGDDGDPEHLHVGRLQKREHGHLVSAAGACTVLIDEDETLLRRKQ